MDASKCLMFLGHFDVVLVDISGNRELKTIAPYVESLLEMMPNVRLIFAVILIDNCRLGFLL